jgi:thiol-disulfide isomerase/thioredoxin
MPYKSSTSMPLLFLLLLTVPVLASATNIGPRVGQQAPEFNITDLKGQPHSLTQLRDKGYVLVVFWSTRCHVCHSMIPEFKRVHEQYDGKGLTLVAINVGYEEKDEIDDYVFENRLEYLVLNNDNTKGDVAEAYRLVGTPTIQLIAPDGTVKYRGHTIPKLSEYLKDSNSKTPAAPSVLQPM